LGSVARGFQNDAEVLDMIEEPGIHLLKITYLTSQLIEFFDLM
jgi:hypothetical protein